MFNVYLVLSVDISVPAAEIQIRAESFEMNLVTRNLTLQAFHCLLRRYFRACLFPGLVRVFGLVLDLVVTKDPLHHPFPPWYNFHEALWLKQTLRGWQRSASWPTPRVLISLAWPDPIFAQGRYRLQYKRPAQKRAWYGSQMLPVLDTSTGLGGVNRQWHRRRIRIASFPAW